MLYLPIVTAAAAKNNNSIGMDQALGSVVTTSDTVIAYTLYKSEVEATLTATGKELDPNY